MLNPKKFSNGTDIILNYPNSLILSPVQFIISKFHFVKVLPFSTAIHAVAAILATTSKILILRILTIAITIIILLTTAITKVQVGTGKILVIRVTRCITNRTNLLNKAFWRQTSE